MKGSGSDRNGRTLPGWLQAWVVLVALLASAVAYAVPPDVTGTPIQAAIPTQPGQQVFLNLRQLEVLIGSGPINVASSLGVLVNGQLSNGLVLGPAFFTPGVFTTVCVTIANVNYVPVAGDTYAVQVRASNSEGSDEATVAVTNIAGATINLTDPAQTAACTDGAAAAIANAGPRERTIADTDDRQGEDVQLDGSASSAPAGDEVSTYQWVVVNTTTPQQPISASGVSPNVRLPDGNNVVALTITTDLGLIAVDEVLITITPPASAPTARIQGSYDGTLQDTDGQAGELVAFDGTPSTAGVGRTLGSFRWFVDDVLQTASGAQVNLQLHDGANLVRLTVEDNRDATASDTRVVIVAPSVIVTANSGGSRSVLDTDGQPGELVRFDGSQSTTSNGTIATYTWLTFDTNDQPITRTGAIVDLPLRDGQNSVLLTVVDSNGVQDTDSAVVNVGAVNNVPVIRISRDARNGSIVDSDGRPGELVGFGSVVTTSGGRQVTGIAWFLDGVLTNQTGVQVGLALEDGTNVVRAVVTDNTGATGSDTVTYTVAAPTGQPAPVVTARITGAGDIADTDQQPGETVQLSGASSTTTNGTIVTYAWSAAIGNEQTVTGTGPVFSLRFADGQTNVSLTVTDSNGIIVSTSAVVNVAAATGRPPTQLSSLSGLSPNQMATARALDSVCDRLAQIEGLTDKQQALLTRCDGIRQNNTTANQMDALEELSGDDFAVARTQTLLFQNFQYSGATDRLMALRGGASGVSVAGLNLMIEGRMVPLAQLEQMLRGLIGGASSDADEAGGLLGDRLGLWMRGNYSFGKQESSFASPGFDADQWNAMLGADYRLTKNAVIGVAFAYGNASVTFDPTDEGGLDTKSWAASLYGTTYAAGNFYLDLVLNAAQSDYAATRNITYVDGVGLVAENARGDTRGLTLSGGLNTGYELGLEGFTIAPSIGVFYVDTTIDAFVESGAPGLDLAYDDQKFKSITGSAGLRVSYAWKLPFGVVLPQIRGDYIREFNDDIEVFGVRFAADPFSDPASNPTPPILVTTKNPDTSYWRLGAGLSAQFKYGISAYVEYQRLESYRLITFEDVSMGLRMQKSF